VGGGRRWRCYRTIGWPKKVAVEGNFLPTFLSSDPCHCAPLSNLPKSGSQWASVSAGWRKRGQRKKNSWTELDAGSPLDTCVTPPARGLRTLWLCVEARGIPAQRRSSPYAARSLMRGGHREGSDETERSPLLTPGLATTNDGARSKSRG